MNFKPLVILFLTAAIAAFSAAAQNSDMGSVRKQKEQKQKEIRHTSTQIDNTSKKISRQLNSLRSIEADIATQGKLIDTLNAQLDSINTMIGTVNDSITAIDNRLASLRSSYAKAIRQMYSHSSSFDRLMFIFSAKSFHEGYRRMRYLKQFKKWRERNAEKIKEQMQLLEQEKQHLETLKSQKSSNLTAQQRAKLDLEGQKTKQNSVIKQLRKQDKQLRATLAEQQRQAEALDRELDRLIAEEQRRAAEEEQRRLEEERRRQAEEQRRKQQSASKEEPSASADKEKSEEPTPPRKQEPKREPSELGKEAPSIPAPERKFKGSFENNKGRLLFPVTGKYKIVSTFGQHKHPELKYVKVNNNGIDIEAQPGAMARAIFDGKVSAVFPQDGYHTVVMVRHGKYLSIYVNLSEIYIRKGDTLKAGDAIGKIYSDPDDGGRTILHFEVRREKDKLDPQQWVK